MYEISFSENWRGIFKFKMALKYTFPLLGAIYEITDSLANQILQF